MLPRPARYVPHIYTDQQLAALFAQTDRCHPCSQVRFRHLVMPVLFRTIYACGLRLSEARLLRPDDVDTDAGVLQVRDAKGGKDRQTRHAARRGVARGGATGVGVGMRMWRDRPPGEAKPQTARDYETVGYVISGRAELHSEGQMVLLEPGNCWVVPRHAMHTYKILEPFTAIEATHPPAEIHDRDHPASP